MFMRDFKVIDSAASVEQLRLRLKDNELERYGDPLTPEYVYDVIKRLPRFDNMKRGQQEDAEEFLGFLLAGLHDECAQLIKNDKQQNPSAETITSPTSEQSSSAESGWHEVGAKQKTATTQNSGAIEIESPVTKIFGGKLRSEYKRPGEKASVTLEPYQPLQLDIGEPNINNISDALRNLTRLETLDGAARGARASTKQVHIETLPPVLILHLETFPLRRERATEDLEEDRIPPGVGAAQGGVPPTQTRRLRRPRGPPALPTHRCCLPPW